MSDEPQIAPPGYPSAQGQAVPDLNLAGIQTPVTSFATGHANFADSTPPQNIAIPPLDCADPATDIYMMGVDSDDNMKPEQFNFAGNDVAVPSPATLAKEPAGGMSIAPTSTISDFSVPALKPGDLTGPGIDHIPEFQPDPYIEDLLQYFQPMGTKMFPATQVPMMPDPATPDLSEYNQPNGLTIPNPMMVDPSLPDLQSPQLTQDVTMQGRPGDMADGALDVMHDGATYKQIPVDQYEELYMNGAGNNSRRERHMGMMDYGLDREER